MGANEEKGNGASITGARGSENGYHLEAIPVPGPPTLSVRLPPSSSPPVRHPGWGSSFDESANRHRLLWQTGSDMVS